MEDFERRIQAAQGYHELRMYRDALAELDGIQDATITSRPAVLELRILILVHARRWKEALTISRKLCAAAPDLSPGYIHSAYCLHELGRTAEARELLINGPECLLREGTYYYNMACYECALGNEEAAFEKLSASFALDRRLRESAKNDPDLKPLWARL